MSYNVLPLESDGTTYTGPRCMQGVPVAKIVEGDIYWVDAWTSFSDMIKTMDDKLDIYKQNISQSIQTKRPLQPYHALVGLKEYFETEGFHPNQLLSKDYILGTGLVNMEVLFRLKNILEILKTAREVNVIRVQPLTWLRGRLAHIIQNERSKITLNGLLQSFEIDLDFDSVQNVTAMILNPAGYVRPKTQHIQVKEDHTETRVDDHKSTSKGQDVKNKTKKDDFRTLHQKTFVPAHVNRDLKARYQAYLDSQAEAMETCDEELFGESSVDSEYDVEDEDYVD